MKIALVHDYLIDYGGAERVLSTLHEIYPDAPIYVSIYRKNNLGKFAKEFEGIKIIQSWFGYLPFADKIVSPLRFLLPLIWNSFDFSRFDLIITSASWAVTKGLAKGKTKEICYLHSPPRYLYGYDTSRNWKGKWFSKFVDIFALVVNHFMRMYDFRKAQKVDFFIANSKNTGTRIEKFYKRFDYKVIYPPVDVLEIINFQTEIEDSNYYLTGGRFVASKNFDLIIKACIKAKVKLKIFGSGIEERNLKSLQDNSIEFLGRVDDQKLVSLYRNAKAFIVAQVDEDFGITPIEAAAAGCPTIAYRGGGYLETVIDGKTGVLFNDLSVESISQAVKRLERIKIDPEDFIKQAKKFSKERFKKQITAFTKKILK